ncbi:DNA-processing protein DprA [Crenobacter sp. SG2305]|uniref:DNA-processing protein DprA n=1 Tax=Crenobacter oryzisoli TaxID=3056844 RepID=UPI0025AAC1D7|nr:DNA-processing protein DprA [Crenobacter sp. SG2305]MDN0083070.1 DNA-processing protein DprA [Crenobacter sp. SG2305]
MSTPHDWLTLALTPGVGPVGFLKLIEAFGSAASACRASRSQLEPLIGREAADALKGDAAAESVTAALAWAEQPGCSLMTLLDDDYPPDLAASHGPPPLLFLRGRRELLTRPMLAVVGSRHATPQGCRDAEAFAAGLAGAGYTVVSGLAAGVDAAAHRGALAQPASTVAVIGTGIDRVYPAGNKALAQQIAEAGLIVSEFALGIRPLAGNFPRRNRIIAALTRGCLVVEASVDSGSLITARLAAEAGREVLAIPGSIHNPQARGCHRLLKEGAKLVETVDDVLDEVGRPAVPKAEPRRRAAATEPPQPAEAETPLLAALGFEPVDADTLAVRLGLTAQQVYAMLLEQELAGRVASLPGGRFQRLG